MHTYSSEQYPTQIFGNVKKNGRREDTDRRGRRWSWEEGVKEEERERCNWWRTTKLLLIELMTWSRLSFESSDTVALPLLPPISAALVLCAGSITALSLSLRLRHTSIQVIIKSIHYEIQKHKLVPIFISDLNDAEDQTIFVGKAQIFKRKSRKDWSTNKHYHHQF